MRTISIIGITTEDGKPTEKNLVNEPPIASIISAELLVALHDHRSFQVLDSHGATTASDYIYVPVYDGAGDAPTYNIRMGADGSKEDFYVYSGSNNAARKKLTVVTVTPDADGRIQLTDVNKFKLFLDTGMKVSDTLILKVVAVGEIMRP